MLNDYLTDAAILDRAGIDTRWAVVCTRLSKQLQAAADHPHFAAAVKRVERALYYRYELGDDFYPQFQQILRFCSRFWRSCWHKKYPDLIKRFGLFV